MHPSPLHCIANALALSDSRCTFCFSKYNLFKVSREPDYLHPLLRWSHTKLTFFVPSKDEMTKQGIQGYNMPIPSQTIALLSITKPCIFIVMVTASSSIQMMVTRPAILYLQSRWWWPPRPSYILNLDDGDHPTRPSYAVHCCGFSGALLLAPFCHNPPFFFSSSHNPPFSNIDLSHTTLKVFQPTFSLLIFYHFFQICSEMFVFFINMPFSDIDFLPTTLNDSGQSNQIFLLFSPFLCFWQLFLNSF